MAESLQTDDVLAFQSGDRATFQKIYLHYYQPICSLIHAIVQNTAEAADIYQKILIELWLRRGKYGDIGAIRGFLYTSARNAALDYLRAAQTKAKAHHEIHFLAQKEEPWKHVEHPGKDIIEEVYALTAILTPRCREVFNLVFVQGKKTKEIAKQLNISISTVLSHKNRALKLIRNDLLKNNLFAEG